MKQYRYNTLIELDELSDKVDEYFKVNIYAFISDLKIFPRSKNIPEDSLVTTHLELRDRSLDTEISCTIYSESMESFPDQVKNGQIIRMHRAKIRKMPDGKLNIYGKLKTAGFSVLLFSGQLGDSFTPIYQSSATFTLVSDYEEKITSLRMLSTINQPMALESLPSTLDGTRILDLQYAGITSVSAANRCVAYFDLEKLNEIIRNANIHHLNELFLGSYSDIVVQAIALFTDDRNSVILRCWDTTSPPRKAFVLDAGLIQEVIYRNEEMEMRTANYWCDIVLYEEHAVFARNNVKCGDILLLINAHLYHSKNGVALTMHGGGRQYNRSIIILDSDNKLKLDILRSIDEFNSNKIFHGSNMPVDVEYSCNNVDDEQQHSDAADVGQMTLMQSFDEANNLENEQIESLKYSARERMRQVHATQLAWIYTYIWKKKQHPNVEHQRSFNLARMAVQFIVRQTLERLLACNKDLFANLAKLSRRQRNTILSNFLLKYVEGTFGDELTTKLTNPEISEGDKQSDDECKSVKITKMNKDKTSKNDGAWSLLCNLLPGTVLKLSNWQVNFSYNANTRIVFALICNRCNLWCTTSARNFNITPLCPACFKRDITDSHLFLQCYFPFNGIPHEAADPNKKYYFLFPIQLLAFFLVDVPESPREAAHCYRRGVSKDQRKALAISIQEKMLSKYSLTLNEIIVRTIKGDLSVLEVGKLTFADR